MNDSTRTAPTPDESTSRAIAAHNREAWNRQAQSGSRWSQPVDAASIKRAAAGDWQIILTPNTPVPPAWFPSHPRLDGLRILGLASGGGQQGPVLAAAGASVTIFDNSDEQLQRDTAAAQAHSLDITCIQGDMADLAVFAADTFDCIVHPVSNVFVPDVLPVWRECWRVLKPGGRLLSGFMNPVFFLIDHEEMERTGALHIRNKLPYSDLEQMPPKWVEETRRQKVPFEFGHTLEQLIGGQLNAGLVLRGLYEDDWEDEATLLNRHTPTFIATWAEKPLPAAPGV